MAYHAKIAEKGRLVDVGSFASEVEAARAHDRAAVAAGKAAKRLNFGAVRGEVAVHVGSLGLSTHRHEARPMGMAVWHAHLPAKRLLEDFRKLRDYATESLDGTACLASALTCADADPDAGHHGRCACPRS